MHLSWKSIYKILKIILLICYNLVSILAGDLKAAEQKPVNPLRLARPLEKSQPGRKIDIIKKRKKG